MKYIIGKSGYKARTDEVMEMLGVKRLPAKGIPMTLIQGFWIFVKPAPEKTRWKSSKHRIMVITSCCDREISAGRLFQHKCKGTK